MYATIRLYRLSPIFERDFTVYWTLLSEELKVRGYIDSATLHRESRISYISYVHWKSAEHYERIKSQGVEEFNPMMEKVSGCCNSVHELHRMEVITKEVK